MLPLIDFDNQGTAIIVPGQDTLDSRITFTRASNATYFDATGTLQTDSTDVARFDYNPLTLQPRGLLLEGARTNSIRNSQADGGGSGTLPTNWNINVAGGLSVTSLGNFTVNGFTVHRFQLSGTTTGTSFSMRFENTTQIVAATGQTWASSLYVREFAGSQTNITSIDTEVQERDAAGAFLVAGSSTITVGTSLARGSHVRTLANAGTLRVTNSFRLNFASGVAIDVTFDLCAPQLELGSFASSYIPTTGTAATRAIDTALNSVLSSIGFNPNVGTLLVEFESAAYPPPASQFWVPARFSDGTGSNAINPVYRHTSGEVRGNVVTGGVDQGVFTNTNITTPGTIIKTALGYQANNCAISVNGSVVATDLSVTLPTVDRLEFAQGQFFGWIRRLTYFPTRLSNAQLQALTV